MFSLCLALRYYALPWPCVALPGHATAVPRLATLCLCLALWRQASPSPCTAISCLAPPSPGLAMPCLCAASLRPEQPGCATPSLRLSKQGQYRALPRQALPLPRPASPCHRRAWHCAALLNPALAVPGLAARGSATAMHHLGSQCLCVALLATAVPRLRAAGPRLAMPLPLRRIATRRRAVPQPFSSFHEYLPLPLFRHCPSPRYAP